MLESADSSENIRIRDSGTACHYCNSDESIYDNRAISENITVGNGKTMGATTLGHSDPTLSKLMKNIPSLLQDVKFVPDLWVNLFSINKALKNDGIIIHLRNGADIASLDMILKTKSGFVSDVSSIQSPSNWQDQPLIQVSLK